MAILTIVTPEGVTKEIYESLRKEVNWEGDHPQGEIVHIAGFRTGENDNSSGRVIGIWDSEEAFNNFVSTRLMPVLEKHNIARPKAEIYQVQNMNLYPTAEKYKIAEA
jgi:hypothetical protein